MGPDADNLADSLLDGDPCVSEFLARHGIANQETAQPVQPAPAAPAPAPTDTHIFEGPTDQSIEQKLGLATSGIQAVAQTLVGDPTMVINPAPAQPGPPIATPAATPTQPMANAATAPPVQRPRAAAPPVSQLPARRKREVADQKSADAMRQLRSVANSISVSISRSNQVKEKLHEAARFLAIAMIAGLAALGLACFTSTAQSFIFFAAMLTLVLGLLCAYRTTMIMTRLRRVAKL